MKKRGIRCFFVLAFGGVLLSGAANERISIAPNDNKGIESGAKAEWETETESMAKKMEKEVEEAATEYSGNVLFSEYDCLNKYDWIEWEYLNVTTQELREMGMCLYSQELNGEFVPVIPEDCSFPEELVVAMEDIFYHSADSYQRDKEGSYAEEKFRELGSEKFKVQSEDERNRLKRLWTEEEYLWDECIDVYHFYLTEDTENYIFVRYFVSSSVKMGDVYLMEKAGDGLTLRNCFEIESCGGELIQYGGEFYFISWEENRFLDIPEGLRIHRLSGNPEEETLCIRYWPEEYIWLDSYDRYVSKDMRDYVEQLKKEFAQGRYLSREDSVPTEIYYGDEKDWELLELNEYGTMGYKVDIANCGLPVYVRKDMVRESKYDSFGHVPEKLKARFFYYDTMTNDFTELEEMSYSAAKQLWFKKIQVYVYTCWMEHICDFNYVFHIAVVEKYGEEVHATESYSSAVVPRRKFVVTEEPVDVIL